MVLVVGAGVAGLVMSKCLSDFEIEHEVVDRNGCVGGAYSRMYPKMLLASPTRYLRLPNGPEELKGNNITASDYSHYLEKYAARLRIRPRQREVLNVEHSEKTFSVTFQDSSIQQQFQTIIVCTGMYDNPCIPKIRGVNDDAYAVTASVPVIHARNWQGPPKEKGKRLLIVGARMTAIELAEECVRMGVYPILSARTEVTVAPREVLGLDLRQVVYPLMGLVPLRIYREQCLRGWHHIGIDRGFRKFRSQGLLEVQPEIQGVHGRQVTFVDGTTRNVDEVVLATGYRFDVPFLPGAVSRRPSGSPLLRQGESVDWPQLFCLGFPCGFRIDSHFVHGIVADAKYIAQALRRRSTS